MKKNIPKYILIILPLIFFQIIVFAENYKSFSSSNVIFEGRIIDAKLNSTPNKFVDFYLIYSRYPFNSSRTTDVENKIYKLKVKNNQKFRLILPFSTEKSYIHFEYSKNQFDPDQFKPWIDQVYIVEKGDVVNCVLSPEGYKFYGSNSNKFNCQAEILKIRPKQYYRQGLIESKEYNKLMLEDDKRLDSCLELRKNILKKYRSSLSRELNNVLLANCYGLRYFESFWTSRLFSEDDNEYYLAFINSRGYKNAKKKLDENINQKSLVSAPIFTDFLFERIMMLTRKYSDHKLEANSSPDHIKQMYKMIISDYNGLIRDKLLASFFINWYNKPSISEYFNESLNLMKNVLYKNVILEVQKKNLTGVPFYSFSLENVNGNIIRLEDLNNKIVIVDFWYTGCPGCANLKRVMAGVWETFKNNTNVSFVSISIDKDKDQWKNSVLSRIYTEPEAINLYTGGKGKDHPMISSLKITAYPKTYILKEGKVYSANPPWPSGPDVSKGTTKEYIDLIKKALQNNKGD